MTKIATLKAQAANLRAALEKTGVKLTQAQALETVAGQYGYPNWDSLSGILKKKKKVTRPPVLADLPGWPDTVYVERGPHGEHCNVDSYEEELIELLHDEPKLREFLEENKDVFPDGMESAVFTAQADGQDFNFTVEDLLGAEYQELGGRGTWCLRDCETFLRFNYGDAWTPGQIVVTPAAEVELRVPEMVKSTVGCHLVVVPCRDGAMWNSHVLVPPQLDPQVIADKIDQELIRLKELDAALPEGQEDKEYTVDDLATFIASIGCTLVRKQVQCKQSWD